MAPPDFRKVRGNGANGCAFRSLFFVFVLNAFDRAESGSRSGGLRGILLRAGSPFD